MVSCHSGGSREDMGKVVGKEEITRQLRNQNCCSLLSISWQITAGEDSQRACQHSPYRRLVTWGVLTQVQCCIWCFHLQLEKRKWVWGSAWKRERRSPGGLWAPLSHSPPSGSAEGRAVCRSVVGGALTWSPCSAWLLAAPYSLLVAHVRLRVEGMFGSWSPFQKPQKSTQQFDYSCSESEYSQ